MGRRGRPARAVVAVVAEKRKDVRRQMEVCVEEGVEARRRRKRMRGRRIWERRRMGVMASAGEEEVEGPVASEVGDEVDRVE